METIKVLLVDDERSLLLNFKQILEFEDFEVITASNGVEGLKAYEDNKPDIIVCDVTMPEMDGYTFLQQLRLRNYTEVPFIFLTAKSEYDDMRKGMLIGGDDYLVKPVKSSHLIEAIRMRLGRKKEIQESHEN